MQALAAHEPLLDGVGCFQNTLTECTYERELAGAMHLQKHIISAFASVHRQVTYKCVLCLQLPWFRPSSLQLTACS